MYLHRYLRYTPALAVVILFYMSFMKFLGSGPFFNTFTQNCENNWWSALLHVSVYTNAFEPVRPFSNLLFKTNSLLSFSATTSPGTSLLTSSCSSSVRF